MVFVGAGGAGERDVAVAAGSGARVGDLALALSAGVDVDAALVVDGHKYGGQTVLDSVPLCQGSRVEAAGDDNLGPLSGQPAGALTPPVVEVRVTGGLDAGQRFLLPAGHYLIGRDCARGVDVPLASGTVSTRHAALTVDATGGCRLTDLGSRNGVRIERSFAIGETPLPFGAVVELGAMQLVVVPIAADDRPLPRLPGSAGMIAFDRMPRTVSGWAPAPLRTPAPLAAADHSARLSLAAVLAPLVIAGLLLVLMPRNSMFVVFMVLSPVLMVATWAEERRRGRKAQTAARRRHRGELDAFLLDVEAARLVQLERLRCASPDLAETVRRACAPSTQLWERRPGHDDFAVLVVGTADVPWRPVLEERGEPAAEIAELIAPCADLPLAPVVCGLRAGRCLGVVGPREQSLSLVRALVVQAAVQHGPADLAIAVLTEPDRIPAWDWAKWLPHVRTQSGGRLLAGTMAQRQLLAAGLLRSEAGAESAGARLHLAVMDAAGVTSGRSCQPRELLTGAAVPVAAIIVASRLDELPDACTDIIEITHPDGLACYRKPADGQFVAQLQLAGLSAAAARAAALALARYEDADLVEPGAGLPDSIALPALFEPDALTTSALERRWSGRRTPGLAAPIGAGPDGPLVVDLVKDGPHGLIAGTTGAGKSELLRTVIASLAANYSPRDVTFVLIDYKGGSAFAECARLPHTVGMVTDLDEHLGSRALTCLEAELRHRERLLRAAGATDLLEYVGSGEPSGPLARLVVAIDEFATLAAELPDFIDALVGVAQRGRSLGVHLLLATQRPRGAVKDNIRANSNLRIALRVHDAADSGDVLDAPDAAAISRQRPGRALLRLGPGELVAFQSAFVSGAVSAVEGAAAVVRIRPSEFGPGTAAADDRPGTAADDRPGTAAATAGPAGTPSANELPTDLAMLVDAAVAAAKRLDLAKPRQPWPDPLPARLALAELPAEVKCATGWSAPIGLADEPASQRQVPYLWQSQAGGMLLYGVAGSGTSTALATIALALARRYSPAELHIYAMDFGSQLLAPLAGLPHVGAVVGPTERERQERLIRRLRAEVANRQERFRASGAAGIDEHNAQCAAGDRLPGIVVMLDNWSAFASAFDDLGGLELRDALARVIADGPGLGIFTVITADRANAVPVSIAGLIAARLVFRLSDQHEFGAFGIPARDLPDFVPGRAVDAATRREVQMAIPAAGGIGAAVAQVTVADHDRGLLPRQVLTLPDDVSFAEVGSARVAPDEWWLPFGIGDRTLERIGFRLGEGDHALIAGAARAGKSSLLLVLARVARSAAKPPRMIVIAAPRSPLHALNCGQTFGVDDESAAVELARADDSPCLLLVDDAERADDAAGAIRGLLSQRRPGDRVIAAGRADALRASYGHWTQELRRSRQGIVLKPNTDVDGDLWGMLLPRRGPSRFGPGRGYLVLDGEAELVQVARP